LFRSVLRETRQAVVRENSNLIINREYVCSAPSFAVPAFLYSDKEGAWTCIASPLLLVLWRPGSDPAGNQTGRGGHPWPIPLGPFCPSCRCIFAVLTAKMPSLPRARSFC